MLSRREFLILSSVAGALSNSFSHTAFSKTPELSFGEPGPFNFLSLVDRARKLAAAPFAKPEIQNADVLDTIDYDAFQKIVFRRELGIGEGGDANFPVQLFHLGRYFKEPVAIYVVDQGFAREVRYRRDYFRFGDAALAKKLPDDLGFSGFRLQNGQNAKTDWVAFLGGSYFRSSGELDQYGLSARAVAIDTALSTPEEFPRFTAFWLEPGKRADTAFTVYALMDGPSVTGAFRIVCAKDTKVQMDVSARFFTRKEIKRLGVAPLTSMFWFGENNREQAMDWRPEIHDSDGLALWTGNGERIWRPLNNPSAVTTNSFSDKNPKGFGLLQRDRAFSNYEDDGVFYDRRPSVWVEPMGEWGSGAVQLVEIPTDDEIHDNVVAYWVPDEPIKAGLELAVDYRLFWNADEPYPSHRVACVVHTRLGRGGIPGQPRPKGVRKFVIDFVGGPLDGLKKSDTVKPIVTASAGTISNVYALQVVGTKTWRAFFDLASAGEPSVDLRLYLKLGETTLSETWLYQYRPGATG